MIMSMRKYILVLHLTIKLIEYTFDIIIILMGKSDQNLNRTLLEKQGSFSSKKSTLSQLSDNPEVIVNEQPFGFFGQARLLIYKNTILTFSNPKSLIFLIITPFLLSLFLYVFQDLARESGKRTLTNPPTYPLGKFNRCFGEDCVSLHFRLLAQSQKSDVPDWVKYSIEYIKQQTGLTSKDITSGSHIVTYNDLENYYKDSAKHPNRTQISLFFCEGGSDDLFINMVYCNGEGDFTYYLVINKTDSLSVVFHDFLEPIPKDFVAANLKSLIDNSLLSYSQNKDISKKTKKIEYSYAQYPIGQNKYIDNYDIVTTIGAFYFLITPLFAFLFIQNEIVKEKEYKLRQGLNIFGARHTSYWASWFVVSNFYSLVVSFSTYFAGLSFGFGFFTNTPFYIIVFFLMFPFTLAMQMLAYFIATVSPSLKASNTISYGIMLFAIVIQSFVSDNTLLTFLFTEDASNIVIFLRYFFCCYPPFSYTKIFTNISQYSGYHFSLVDRRWVEGVKAYDNSIFTQSITNPLPFGGGTYYRYSDLISMVILFGDCLFYMALAWYFDNTIASNRGRAEPFYYPINKIVACFRKNKKAFASRDAAPLQESYAFQDEEDSAKKQRQKVFSNSRNKASAFGLRIVNLSKTFQKLFSNNKVQALKNFTLEVEANELMGILGHNGAGKTTLINILTGVIAPDKLIGSEIIIDNNHIQNIDQIRKHIGVCSQFDILWNQLTAYDHLYMFARLKGIKSQEIDEKIDEVLSFVSLLPEKKNKVGSFSGGMKRRLSLAIAAISNPKIILLDEPTTGLDPKVRAQVWELIQKLKVGKSIILTTHSMEQADVLADRISVIVKGKLKCIGTPFYLKKTYGDGHRIAINLKNKEQEGEVVERIRKMFPSMQVVDCRGGSLIIGISEYTQLVQLVRKLQNKESQGLDEYELKNAIKAWSVSHSTLEEVFMKVSRQKQQ